MSLKEFPRSRLSSRYNIQGNLLFETAMHVGGQRSDFATTESPVIRDASNRPFIPGSSIKGAVRSAVERIVPQLDLEPCGIFDQNVKCLTSQEESEESPRANYGLLLKGLGRKWEDDTRTALQMITTWTGRACGVEIGEIITEDTLLEVLDCALCDVCKAFGAPFLGSSLYFQDAYVDETFWVGLTQIRDGVGIDRDSGRAVDKIKYDYEVVPSETAFKFAMTIESDNPQVLGMAALALHELQEGNISLGGLKSRGLGRCKLDSAAFVEAIESGNRAALFDYLREGKKQRQPVKEFVKKNIEHILP